MLCSTRWIKSLAIWIFLITTVVAIVFIGVLLLVYKGINFEADEKLFENSLGFNSTTFYAESDGEIIAIETSGNIRKVYYSLDEISEYVKDGFIAVEDKIFYDHKGIDLKRTAMATVNYITKQRNTFGASTITQQVIKNISGDNQTTIKRKAEEIIRAIHIERKYTKEEILEVYLNVIPMGDNIYGIGAASKAYFKKEPKELTPYEAATLIGITNAPTAYSPYNHPKECIKKRNIVLGVMRNDDVISDEEYSEAINVPLGIIAREDRDDRFDSWFVEYAIDEVCSDLKDKYNISMSAARMMLLGGGYKVYTTMNPRVQKILEYYFEDPSNFPEEIKEGLNYAMTVIDSESGRLVGIIGRVGKKTGNRLLNHAVTCHVPGSTLKPFALYAPLIDEGIINWASVFDDVPVSFIEKEGEYREYPKNSPNVYDGLTTIKDALRYSKNTVAVRLCNILGIKRVYNSLKNDFGFKTLVEREGDITDIAIAPMALGQLCYGVSLLKLTECFATFPREGILRETTSYTKVIDHNSTVVLEKQQAEKIVFKPTTAKIMNQMMMCVTENGTAGKITLKNTVDTAGKTGTSSGSKDKLFIGYTPYYTAGIWCGYDKGNGAMVNLSKSHIEIWDQVMTLIHSNIDERESKEFSKDGLYYLPYCKDSGKIYSENCVYDPRGDRMDYGYFSEDNAPTTHCDRHIICMYDTESKGVATSRCPKENIAMVSLISVSDRSFPKQIVVTDAEFVYRDTRGYEERPIDKFLPYFYYSIPDGSYVGESKGKKQFNAACDKH